MRAKFNFVKKPAKFEYEPKSDHDLITVLIIVTENCVNRCTFCGEDSPNKKVEELNTEELLRVIDQAKECGTKEILLSGGEPLLRKDFKQIAKRIKDNGMEAVMCTNGYFLDQYIDFLEDIKFDTIQVSINAFGEKSYNKLCNPPKGAWKKIMKSLDLMQKKYSGRVILSAVPLKSNKDEMIKIMRLAKKKNFQRFVLIKPLPIGRSQESNNIIPEKEYIKFLDKLIQEFIKLNGEEVFLEQPYARYSKFAEKYGKLLRYNYNCLAGIHYLSITSDGFVIPCATMTHLKEFRMGNVRRESLTEIWNDKKRWAKFYVPKECSKFCKHFGECTGGCKTLSYMATGNMLSKDPFCEFWIGNPK
jgi:radical SAM protein with 4Fe4S-binding SPASM domain